MTDRSELATHYVPTMTVLIATANDPEYPVHSSASQNHPDRAATLRALREHAPRLGQQGRLQTVRRSKGVQNASRGSAVDDSSSRVLVLVATLITSVVTSVPAKRGAVQSGTSTNSPSAASSETGVAAVETGELSWQLAAPTRANALMRSVLGRGRTRRCLGRAARSFPKARGWS